MTSVVNASTKAESATAELHEQIPGDDCTGNHQGTARMTRAQSKSLYGREIEQKVAKEAKTDFELGF
jgi:hypothetical protein